MSMWGKGCEYVGSQVLSVIYDLNQISILIYQLHNVILGTIYFRLPICV